MASNPTDPTAQDLRILGRALRELRKQAGLTQKEMGARAGVRDTYISEVESGRRSVRWITVTRFLRVLGADLRQLVGALEATEKKDPARSPETVR
jgi:transcriptional regulator with XRE-family HTH domain